MFIFLYEAFHLPPKKLVARIPQFTFKSINLICLDMECLEAMKMFFIMKML